LRLFFAPFHSCWKRGPTWRYPALSLVIGVPRFVVNFRLAASPDARVPSGYETLNPMLVESDIEIRQIFTPEDFGDALTPELRENEARLRAESEGEGAPDRG